MTQLRHLRRLVRSRLGVPMTDQMFTDDQLDDHINLAVQTVDAEQRWPWREQVETVVIDPDEPDIVLASEWRATRGLYVAADSTELGLVSPSDLLSYYMGATAARPEVWAPISDRIMLRPLPSGPVTLLHYFYTEPAWLHDDDDSPDLPDQFIGAVVAKAAELLSTREDDRAAAAAHTLEYNDWIERMRRDVRRSTTPVNIRVRSGSWI